MPTYGGRRLGRVKILGNGNCLFGAVADLLKVFAGPLLPPPALVARLTHHAAPPLQRSPQEVRLGAVEYMETHRDHFESDYFFGGGGVVVQGPGGSKITFTDFVKYCNVMRTPGWWGGLAELEACAHQYHLKILVFEVRPLVPRRGACLICWQWWFDAAARLLPARWARRSRWCSRGTCQTRLTGAACTCSITVGSCGRQRAPIVCLKPEPAARNTHQHPPTPCRHALRSPRRGGRGSGRGAASSSSRPAAAASRCQAGDRGQPGTPGRLAGRGAAARGPLLAAAAVRPRPARPA